MKGHFGPINSVMFTPDGKGYASGGEDGYVRVHQVKLLFQETHLKGNFLEQDLNFIWFQFDEAYFDFKFDY